MSALSQTIAGWRDRMWEWFTHHAQSPHALWWLVAVSFTDTIFSPLPPEVFLVALMLAHPKRWKQYLSVAIISSTVGAIVAFYIAVFLFNQIGQVVLHLYGLQKAFAEAQHLLEGRVFWTMMIASFTPIPDKVFIYAAGFLQANFLQFIGGYVIGRCVRMALICYLTGRFGRRVLEILDRYFLWVGGVLLVLVLYYGTVHFHLFGL